MLFTWILAADLGLSDPVFQKRLVEDGIDLKKDPAKAGAKWIDNVWHGQAHSSEKMSWPIKLERYQWRQLVYSQTTQSVADAKEAVEVGYHGIVVSNHAGRQVDGAVTSLDVLEQIVQGKLHRSM